MQRVQIRDGKCIRHQRAGARTASRPHRAAIVLGPVDEVGHNQEIAGKTHLDDDVQLKREALFIFRAPRVALICIREKLQQPFLQAVGGLLAEKLLHALTFGHGKIGQLRLAEFQRHIAASRNFHGIFKCAGNIGKQRLHFLAALEILLLGELAHAARIAQNLAAGNAHARFVRLVILAAQKLDGVRRHHRQAKLRRQRHGAGKMRLIIGAPGALQLDVKTLRKHGRQAPRRLRGIVRAPLQQRRTQRPRLRAR